MTFVFWRENSNFLVKFELILNELTDVSARIIVLKVYDRSPLNCHVVLGFPGNNSTRESGTRRGRRIPRYETLLCPFSKATYVAAVKRRN